MKKKLFHYTFFTVNKAPLLHQVRDLALFIDVMSFLKDDFEFSDFFLNQPHMPKSSKESCDFVFDKGSLVVLTTRPPLHEGGNRPIYRSEHYLEKYILEKVADVFSSLSRDLMYLQRAVAKSLKKGYSNRGTIDFYVNRTRKSGSAAGYRRIAPYIPGAGRSWVSWSSAGKKRPPTSCGFILYFKETPQAPRILIVFGMGGEEGLIFSRILRNGLWDKLEFDLSKTGPSRAIMVEFEVKIPATPTSLKFVDEMKGKVILDMEL